MHAYVDTYVLKYIHAWIWFCTIVMARITRLRTAYGIEREWIICALPISYIVYSHALSKALFEKVLLYAGTTVYIQTKTKLLAVVHCLPFPTCTQSHALLHKKMLVSSTANTYCYIH